MLRMFRMRSCLTRVPRSRAWSVERGALYAKRTTHSLTGRDAPGAVGRRDVVRVEADHEVGGGVGSFVAKPVRLLRRLEDHVSCFRVARDPVLEDRQRSVAHDHQLLMRMPVRRVRRLPRCERRDVHLEPRQVCRRRIDERSKHRALTCSNPATVGSQHSRGKRRTGRDWPGSDKTHAQHGVWQDNVYVRCDSHEVTL